MKKIVAPVLALAALVLAASPAWADSCETYPGSQVYTDQGCDKPYDNSARQNAPQPQQQAPRQCALCDALRKSLNSNSAAQTTAGSGRVADQLYQRITDAGARLNAALADPTAAGAQDRYNAALKDLHAAYEDAAKADPGQADAIRAAENEADASASQRAANANWNAPAAAANAAPAAPSGPDNVTAVGSTVYVCDSAIAGANNVSCREIAADGQCTGVTLADGGVGWRDSIATPCSASDLSQRQSFLGGNSDAAAAVQQAPAGFSMDPAETQADMQRLLAAPPPERDLDPAAQSDWTDAMADHDNPPSLDDMHAATPMDIASMEAPNDDADDSDSGSSMDDAIDMLNAASSILGAASAIAGHGGGGVPSYSSPRAPSYRPPPTAQFHPPPPMPVIHCSNGAPTCVTTAQ